MNLIQNNGGQQLFIEFFNCRPEWEALAHHERRTFVEKVSQEMAGLPDRGIQLVAWGENDRSTGHRLPYDFFCVYMLPSVWVRQQFESEIEASGWYRYFDQAVVSGQLSSPGAVLDSLAGLKGP